MEVVIVGAGRSALRSPGGSRAPASSVTLVDQFEPGDRRASSGGGARLYRCAPAPKPTTRRWRAARARCGASSRTNRARTCSSSAASRGSPPRGRMGGGVRADAGRSRVSRSSAWTSPSAARLYPSFARRRRHVRAVRAGGGRAARGALGADPGGAGGRPRRADPARPGAARRHGRRPRRLPRGSRPTSSSGRAALGSGTLFGDLVSLRVTRAGAPVLRRRSGLACAGVPAWCDYDARSYGTADIDARGVKAASDAEGPPSTPMRSSRRHAAREPEVRAYLRDRFPALEHAALAGARSCRYELTRDTNFLAAPHPAHPSVWLVGGGSGHGFKHGPALAERIRRRVHGGDAASRPLRPGRTISLAGSADGELRQRI